METLKYSNLSLGDVPVSKSVFFKPEPLLLLNSTSVYISAPALGSLHFLASEIALRASVDKSADM